MRYTASLLSVLVGVLCGGALAGPDAATRPAAQFTVATYNINWGNPNLPGVVENIRKTAADLVCLQETNRKSEAYLRRRLAAAYPHKAFRHASGAGGFAYLSKTPLKGLKYLQAKHGMFGTWLCRVTLAGQSVQVASVHLQPVLPHKREGLVGLTKLFIKTESIRAREIAHIHENISKDMPTILAGDFNSPASLTVSQYLAAAGFVDSFAAVTSEPAKHITWRWKYGNVEWKYRLDYLFHTRDIETVTSRIIVGAGSDHYPVVSGFRRAPEKPRPAPGEKASKAKGKSPASRPADKQGAAAPDKGG